MKPSETSLQALPEAWREAYRSDAAGLKPLLSDPLPERRIARLLGAFIAAGLVFLVLPGTLLGVWNLITISAQRQPDATSAAWIQAHGHAQLFGWVGAFIVGISLYALPKFRGGTLRSLPVGWAMFAMWTVGVAARWISGVRACHWQVLWPLSGVLEFAVAVLLLWQCTGRGTERRHGDVWEPFVFTGFAGFVLTFGLQLILLLRPLPAPMIPASGNLLLITLALWAFCLPIVFGFSARFLPSFLGLQRPGTTSAYVSIGGIVLAAASHIAGQGGPAAAATLAAVLAGCWSLRVFHPTQSPPKLIGVDPLYPWFVRLAYVWLIVSALLGFAADAPGILGASRHAFTVGFLATMIFAIGPRILPSFLNSRELWSIKLMRSALILLTIGCTLRVASEPLAYAGILTSAWQLLPVSAVIELTAVVLFGINIGKTLATPVPSWFGREQVRDSMSLYWYIASYPATRKLLIQSGLKTLARVSQIPLSLTVRQAAEADGIDPEFVVQRLGEFFDSRLTPTARKTVLARRSKSSWDFGIRNAYSKVRSPLDNGLIMAKGSVSIFVERCKGCGFCVEFCPTKVLSLSSAFNSKGYHPPHMIAAEKCSGCDLCGMYCPDFAIFGYKQKEASHDS